MQKKPFQLLEFSSNQDLCGVARLSTSNTLRPSVTGSAVILGASAQHSAIGNWQKDDGTVRSPVHLLLCTNSLYLQHAGVCLISLLANNPDLFFDVVIVGRVTELLDEEKLRCSLTRFPNHSLSFRKFIPPADRILP